MYYLINQHWAINSKHQWNLIHLHSMKKSYVWQLNNFNYKNANYIDIKTIFIVLMIYVGQTLY